MPILPPFQQNLPSFLDTFVKEIINIGLVQRHLEMVDHTVVPLALEVGIFLGLVVEEKLVG